MSRGPLFLFTKRKLCRFLGAKRLHVSAITESLMLRIQFEQGGPVIFMLDESRELWAWPVHPKIQEERRGAR